MTERLHFHFHALEKEMAPHSSVLAWRIPGTGKPGGLPSMGSHRVGHDWSDLAAAYYIHIFILYIYIYYHYYIYRFHYYRLLHIQLPLIPPLVIWSVLIFCELWMFRTIKQALQISERQQWAATGSKIGAEPWLWQRGPQILTTRSWERGPRIWVPVLIYFEGKKNLTGR